MKGSGQVTECRFIMKTLPRSVSSSNNVIIALIKYGEGDL